ncbi:MAG: hypothetical protein R6T98_02070 [Desulfatiglandales bacterium]
MNRNRLLIRNTAIVFLCGSFVFILEALTSGPFQKVIIAPLAEEPLKLFVACLFYYEIIYLSNKRGHSIGHMALFKNVFVYFSIMTGILFGLFEYLGSLSVGNIFGHFSNTAIASILIVVWYDKMKYPSKYAGILWISIGMLLHSISNQYANISSVHNSNDYLVCIARFLKANTPLLEQWDYIRVVYVVALAFLLIYFWLYTYPHIEKRFGKT